MISMEITKFSAMEQGKEYLTAVLVKELNDRGYTSSGNPYVTAVLFDGIKTVRSQLWNTTVETLAAQGIVPDAIVQVTMTITPNGNGFYYNVKEGSLCVNDDESVSIKNFVHTAPIDPDEIFDWLIRKIESVDSNPDGKLPYKSISYLTKKLLIENADAFKRSSAAERMHHNFLYGLLYHTARMVSAAYYICVPYAKLDKELLVCAAALHDLAKITCYETDEVGVANISIQGRLLEHSLIGAMMIHEESHKDSYDPERILLLEHMIASHHGKLEWGAVTTPAIPEAEVLHLIDMIDSRINMFEEAYLDQTPGTLSKDKVFGLENSKIYKPLKPEMMEKTPE